MQDLANAAVAAARCKNREVAYIFLSVYLSTYLPNLSNLSLSLSLSLYIYIYILYIYVPSCTPCSLSLGTHFTCNCTPPQALAEELRVQLQQAESLEVNHKACGRLGSAIAHCRILLHLPKVKMALSCI